MITIDNTDTRETKLVEMLALLNEKARLPGKAKCAGVLCCYRLHLDSMA